MKKRTLVFTLLLGIVCILITIDIGSAAETPHKPGSKERVDYCKAEVLSCSKEAKSFCQNGPQDGHSRGRLNSCITNRLRSCNSLFGPTSNCKTRKQTGNLRKKFKQSLPPGGGASKLAPSGRLPNSNINKKQQRNRSSSVTNSGDSGPKPIGTRRRHPNGTITHSPAPTGAVRSTKKRSLRNLPSKVPGALDRIGGTENVAPDLIIASHKFCIPRGPKGATVTIKNIGTSRSRPWYLNHSQYLNNGASKIKKGPPLNPGQSHEVSLKIFRKSPEGRRYFFNVYETEGDPIGLNRGSLTESDISNNIYRGKCIY